MLDGHPVVRLGVRELLSGSYEVEETSTLKGAMNAACDSGGFDVAIVELRSSRSDGEPAGAAMIRAMCKAMPGTGIVAYAGRAERHAASEALRAGASSFVIKSSQPETLRKAVDAAAEADRFVDPAATDDEATGLTRRQRQILQLLADGNSTVDVADRLTLSAETVRTHTKALLPRLKARDRAHAVAIALRGCLID